VGSVTRIFCSTSPISKVSQISSIRSRSTSSISRARAEEIRIASEHAEAEREAAEEKRKAEEAEKIRRARLDSIARRGASVWREVEAEIELRNAKGYEKAAELLRDLRTIADERGGMEDFHARLSAIRERHSTKRTFIERLTDL